MAVTNLNESTPRVPIDTSALSQVNKMNLTGMVPQSGGVNTPLPKTESFANNTGVNLAAGGIQAGIGLGAGIAQNVALSRAGDAAHAESMEALAEQDADARAARALQRKQRALANEQDTYRRMNDVLGVEFNKFQRDLQERLGKYQEMQQHANTMRTAYERNQQIKDAQIAQAGEL